MNISKPMVYITSIGFLLLVILSIYSTFAIPKLPDYTEMIGDLKASLQAQYQSQLDSKNTQIASRDSVISSQNQQLSQYKSKLITSESQYQTILHQYTLPHA